MYKLLLSLLIFCIGLSLAKAKDQKVVQPKQRNSMPSSQYDNPTNREVRMPHPNAKKGLTRITSDKEYLYETKESPQNHSMSVRFGIFEPLNLAGENNIEFSDIYQNSSPIIFIDYEWKWKPLMGELNFLLGTGFYFTQGNGVFKNSPSNPAREKFNFIAIPFTGSLIYKMKFTDNQWLIPFAGAGLGAFAFTEMRDDNDGPKFGGALMAPLFAGGALSLNALSPKTGHTLDRDYGINQALLALEFRQIIGLSDKFDFTGNIINAGLMIEY